MDNQINKLRGKFIPIINWNFFSSEAEARSDLNETTWSGWDPSWTPLATNGLGDAIMCSNGKVYQVQHGTGEPPEPSLISKDINGLCKLFEELMDYQDASEKDGIEVLKQKKILIAELRKQAPKALRDYFDMQLDDIKDAIDDLKFLNTKDGRFMQAANEYRALVFKELRKDGKYQDVVLTKRYRKYVFLIGGELTADESAAEVKAVIEKYKSPYPIEYEFKHPAEEETQ